MQIIGKKIILFKINFVPKIRIGCTQGSSHHHHGLDNVLFKRPVLKSLKLIVLVHKNKIKHFNNNLKLKPLSGCQLFKRIVIYFF